MRKPAILIVAALLGGCAQDTVIEERIVKVDRPVPQPCAGSRPADVTPLSEEYTDPEWYAMDVRQKAAAVGRKGLERQQHGEALAAATGACP